MRHALIGDWRARMKARLAELGFANIDEFLARYPAVPYLKLPEILGKDVAIPILIVKLQLEEAKDGRRLRAAAMDCLAREINHYLSTGWAREKPGMMAEEKQRSEFLKASACTSWVTQIEMTDSEARAPAMAVWLALVESNPGTGWRPSGQADPVIEGAFRTGWPE